MHSDSGPGPRRRTDTDDLPRPDDHAQAVSDRLVERVREVIERSGGAIDFARFMGMVLYEPGLGYYSAGSRKFGAEGDFVTAPEISPWFSRCLAHQAEPVLRALGGGDILEPGAGSGVMAAEVLAELERRDCLPERYLILEPSADLCERQATTLRERVPGLVERVEWLGAMPEGLRGVLLANEVLDAMPVHRFRIVDGEPRELFVGWDGGLVWHTEGESQPRVRERLAALPALPEGYESELPLAAEAWTRSLDRVLDAGLALLIDYGFPRHEFYHAQRAGGTLMCHYRHRSHTDPFLFPGLQDITAHVEFTGVAEAGHDAGFDVAGFTTQAHFLLGTGLAQAMETVNPVDQRAQMALAQQIRTLTMPEEMGELFKVLALTRGYDESLAGFAMNDMRGRL